METIDFQHENRFVFRSGFRYVFPPMIGMIFAQIAPIVDGICVANSMGEAALAGIGITGPLDYVFNIDVDRSNQNMEWEANLIEWIQTNSGSSGSGGSGISSYSL